MKYCFYDAKNEIIIEDLTLQICMVNQGLFQPGHITCSKNCKMPFFQRYFKFLPVGNSEGLEPHQNFSFEKISKNKAASPILSFLLYWQEIHFQCNYVLNIFRELESYIDLRLAKFWWSYLERYLNGILLTNSSLLK